MEYNGIIFSCFTVFTISEILSFSQTRKNRFSNYNQSHMLHVWNIYPCLSHLGKCWQIYHTWNAGDGTHLEKSPRNHGIFFRWLYITFSMIFGCLKMVFQEWCHGGPMTIFHGDFGVAVLLRRNHEVTQRFHRKKIDRATRVGEMKDKYRETTKTPVPVNAAQLGG